MADAATYDNGLWTPDAAAATPAVATSAAADETTAAWTSVAAEWEAATTTTTSEDQWWLTTTSVAAATDTWSQTTMTPSSSSYSPSSSSSATTTTPSSSSITTTTATTTSSTTTSASPTTSSSSSSSSQSLSSDASSAANILATVSRYSNPSSTASALAASSSAGSFKLVYLIPVFVALPIFLILAVLAATYGKWWAKGSTRGSPVTERSGWSGPGGAFGSWRSRRSGHDDDLEETGGLVEKAAYPHGAGAEDHQAPMMAKGASRWSNLVKPTSAGRSELPFLSVNYAAVDKPFSPPSRSSSIASNLSRSASGAGWGWGMALPRASSSAVAMPSVSEKAEENQHLTAGVWGMGTASRRYRPKGGLGGGNGTTRSRGSISSRLSDKIFNRNNNGNGGLGVPDIMTSPSIYSPAFEPTGVMRSDTGKYSALRYGDGGIEEDYEDGLEEEKVDYDALLGAARVGDGEDMARRFMRGEEEATELAYASPPPPQQRGSDAFAAPLPPTFNVTLPTAPSRLQASPKKSTSTLMRPSGLDTEYDSANPSATGLLFNYASPPVSPEKRRPLPSVPSSLPRDSPSRGLTDPPARLPFRSQAAPQLSRPPRQSNLPPLAAVAPAPFSPNDQPDLFYTSTSLPRHASAPAHRTSGAGPYAAVSAAPPTVARPRMAPIGSPMPAFEPGVRASRASNFSLLDNGMDSLVFKSGIAEDPSYAPTPAVGGKRPKSRQEEKRKSAAPVQDGVVKPGTVVPSLTALQASRAPSPTKAHPPPVHQQQQVNRHSTLDFSFPDSPALAPLQHPSKVRAAIENLEKRTSVNLSPSPSSPSASFFPSSSSSPDNNDDATLPHPEKRLERVSTVIKPPPGAGARYSRPLGGGRREGLDDDDDDESADPHVQEKKRRLSMLILRRSRSQSMLLEDEYGVDGEVGLAGMKGVGEEEVARREKRASRRAEEEEPAGLAIDL